jgi:hypothetical protein
VPRCCVSRSSEIRRGRKALRRRLCSSDVKKKPSPDARLKRRRRRKMLARHLSGAFLREARPAPASVGPSIFLEPESGGNVSPPRIPPTPRKQPHPAPATTRRPFELERPWSVQIPTRALVHPPAFISPAVPAEPAGVIGKQLSRLLVEVPVGTIALVLAAGLHLGSPLELVAIS